MKKALLFILAAVSVAVLSVSAGAEQWSFFGSADKTSGAFGFGKKHFVTDLPSVSQEPLEVFSDSGLTSFVPIQLDQLVVSLVDVTRENDLFATDEKRFFSEFHLNTGIQTETLLTNSQTHLMSELFGEDTSPSGISSSVIFVGVGLDFKSGYLKGNAFVGRPLDTLTNRLINSSNTDSIKGQGFDTDTLGFEASAGYKLNDKIALGAGFGRMNNKSQKTEQTEEVYAVYAQAILAIAPGIQIIPEFGQIERIKEESVSEETRDESFYAGAIWEIDF